MYELIMSAEGINPIYCNSSATSDKHKLMHVSSSYLMSISIVLIFINVVPHVCKKQLIFFLFLQMFIFEILID